MTAASDRLAALNDASFEAGAHRTNFIPALHDVATVGTEVAADKAATLVAQAAAENAEAGAFDSAATATTACTDSTARSTTPT